MKPLSCTAIVCLTVLCLRTFGQTNSWTRITESRLTHWAFPGLVYSPATGEYVLTMGTADENSGGENTVYQVQVFTHALGKWINALPHDSLYGKWADSTGPARNNGRVTTNVFGTYTWSFKKIEGYLRPNTAALRTARAYGQFCLNTDDNRIYFHINNTTFTYDPVTRLWDTLAVNTHPNAGAKEGFLKWGSLCYDALNKEVVLFGGGGIDDISGTPGTWTFKPSTRTWNKLSLSVEPPARAHSPLVYDPVNKVMVLFGGDHLDHLTNDTWVYDCASRTWLKKSPAVRPSPRAGHAFLYMPQSGKLLMLGGYDYKTGTAALPFEMWKYDLAGNTWELIKRFEAGEAAPRMQTYRPVHCGLAAVDGGDTLLMAADTVLAINSFKAMPWRMACDANITDAAGTVRYGLTSDTVGLRGGWTDPSWFTTGVEAPDTGAIETALRGLVSGTWTQISAPKTPHGGRDWSTTVLDPDRDLFLKWGGGHVAHCGTDIPHYSIHQNRWTLGFVPEWPLEYDGYGNPSPGPFTFNGRPFMPVHTVKSYAYDVRSRKMIYTFFYHTYVYDVDSMDWEKADIHTGFGGSTGYSTGLISTPHGAVCVGNGHLASAAKVYLWEPDSLNWRALPLSGVTLPLFYADAAGVVYDSRRDRVLYTKGSSTASAELYAYEFATGAASRLMPADTLLARSVGRYYRECVYLPALDIVFYQTRVDSANLVYDCANNRWRTMIVKGFVSGMQDRSTGFMYDQKRNLVWSSGATCANYAIRLDSTLTRAEWDRTTREALTLTVSPNPFKPSTFIRFPASGRGSVRVFGADGRLVADLTDQLAGKQSLVWHAKGLSAGTYLVRYEEKGRRLQSRIVLLK